MLVPDWLARVLTMEQGWALRDNGWDDLGEALEEALRRSPDLRRMWNSQNDGDWEAFGGFRGAAVAGIVWDQVFKALGIDVATHNFASRGPGKPEPAPDEPPTPPEDDEPPAPPAKPRQRKPDQIERATVKKLMLALAQRKAELAKGKKLPNGSDLSQEKIAESVDLDRGRIQQAEGLQRIGWDLLRSDPDFLADDGFVRWPGIAKAAEILASGSAEN